MATLRKGLRSQTRPQTSEHTAGARAAETRGHNASDVKVTSRAGRRVVLGHAILSFAYNTVLIAVVINVITDL
jgi:hypothetical protein